MLPGIIPLLKDKNLKLILEPGKSIIANAGILLTRTLYKKQGGSKQFVIVDAGMNDLIRPCLYEAFHFIWPTAVAEPFVPQKRIKGYTTAGTEEVDVIPCVRVHGCDDSGKIVDIRVCIHQLDCVLVQEPVFSFRHRLQGGLVFRICLQTDKLRCGHGAKDPENDKNRNQFNQGEPPLIAGALRMMSVRKLIHWIEQRHSFQD